MQLTKGELLARRAAFLAAMTDAWPDWETVLLAGNVNQYYFTGTMQDALVVMRRDGGFFCFVRRSVARARDESPLDDIYEMNSYREAAALIGAALGRTYVEMDIMTLSMRERLHKNFDMDVRGSCEPILRQLRAVKSPYELYWMEEAGRRQCELMEARIPALLRTNMSEADLLGEIYREIYALGYQGVTRFSRFQAEVALGQIGFGDNSLYPASFDSPGGARGNSAAVPVAAGHGRRLQHGELVFVDLGFGINGYHSDKTQLYWFGGAVPAELAEAQALCEVVLARCAVHLRPGEIPSRIYADVMASLSPAERAGFMGFGAQTVKFLGHGIGLHVDETPVIALGFDEPLAENMVIALEPKKGVGGIGMAGVEETFVVTGGGGRCLTGGAKGILVV